MHDSHYFLLCKIQNYRHDNIEVKHLYSHSLESQPFPSQEYFLIYTRKNNLSRLTFF